MRNGRDRRERLPSKAQRRDRGEIVSTPDFARRMPFERQSRIAGVHSLAIVFDTNLFLAA
jgi:hypothetical protein